MDVCAKCCQKKEIVRWVIALQCNDLIPFSWLPLSYTLTPYHSQSKLQSREDKLANELKVKEKLLAMSGEYPFWWIIVVCFLACFPASDDDRWLLSRIERERRTYYRKLERGEIEETAIISDESEGEEKDESKQSPADNSNDGNQDRLPSINNANDGDEDEDFELSSDKEEDIEE